MSLFYTILYGWSIISVIIILCYAVPKKHRLGKVVGKHEKWYESGRMYYLHVLIEDNEDNKSTTKLEVTKEAYNSFKENDKIVV